MRAGRLDNRLLCTRAYRADSGGVPGGEGSGGNRWERIHQELLVVRKRALDFTNAVRLHLSALPATDVIEALKYIAVRDASLAQEAFRRLAGMEVSKAAAILRHNDPDLAAADIIKILREEEPRWLKALLARGDGEGEIDPLKQVIALKREYLEAGSSANIDWRVFDYTINLVEALCKLNSSNPGYLLLLGAAFFHRGEVFLLDRQYDRAEQDLITAVCLAFFHPQSTLRVMRILGKVYASRAEANRNEEDHKRAGQIASAVACAQEIAQIPDEAKRIAGGVGGVVLTLNTASLSATDRETVKAAARIAGQCKFWEAVKDLKVVRRTNPGNRELEAAEISLRKMAVVSDGQKHIIAGEYDQALAIASAELARTPHDPTFLTLLAEVYLHRALEALKKSDFDAAIVDAQRAICSAFFNANSTGRAVDLLGRAYQGKGNELTAGRMRYTIALMGDRIWTAARTPVVIIGDVGAEEKIP